MRMTDASTLFDRRRVSAWLHVVAGLVFALILVGGATRMTESGLSIVEWRPVTGTLPPLTDHDWQAQFEKYQAIPQFQIVNPGMGLDDFKTIFWWEWGHRLLGRVVGVAFLLPFLWFLWRGAIEPGLRARLWAIFALGALQGAVGWWMVASGLADRVEVSQYRLATHLTLACLIFAAILGTAQRLTARPFVAVSRRIRVSAMALLALVLLQIYLGALVAGLRAGLVSDTWPLIDGVLVPDAARLFFHVPAWRNVFENELTVQFDHRMVAYALWTFAALHVFDVARTLRSGPALTGALALAAAVTLQAALGVLTVIHHVPIGLALAHQAGAIVVLAMAVVHVERLGVQPHTQPKISRGARRPADGVVRSRSLSSRSRGR
jgi:cytochrome c oxidase assembly protein subunit 15